MAQGGGPVTLNTSLCGQNVVPAKNVTCGGVVSRGENQACAGPLCLCNGSTCPVVVGCLVPRSYRIGCWCSSSSRHVPSRNLCSPLLPLRASVPQWRSLESAVPRIRTSIQTEAVGHFPRGSSEGHRRLFRQLEFGWLKRIERLQRHCSVCSWCSLKFFMSAKSRLLRPGPIRTFLPELPKV